MNDLETYMTAIRRKMVGLAESARAWSLDRGGRTAKVGLWRLSKATPEARAATARASVDAMTAVMAERASWIDAKAIRDGRAGPFEATDLRCWLAVAERASIAAIPAREVLHLTDDELGALSGESTFSPAQMTGLKAHVAALAAEANGETDGARSGASSALAAVLTTSEIDRDALEERLFDAMDLVPEGWMVRSHLCGNIRMKALAGAGVAGPTAPEVRFGPEMSAGPGWTRRGNRRRIDAFDDRIQSAYIESGSDEGVTYLARPWITPATMIPCLDPHRAPSPLRGPGWWPIEVRCFVTDGMVTGASNYYPWLDLEPSPKLARVMLDARALTQELIAACRDGGLVPRTLRNELQRPHLGDLPPEYGPFKALLERQGRDAISFSADFLLARLPDGSAGLVLLECGPAAGTLGGVHCLGFSGIDGVPKRGVAYHCEGVAYRQMRHIDLLDPASWVPGDPEGCITSWAETERLAAEG